MVLEQWRLTIVSLLVVPVELYLSPVETYCENINYYIPDEENLTKSFSEERMARLREFQLQRRVVNDVVHLYPLPTLVDVFWDPLN